jgi:hypothetical protein
MQDAGEKTTYTYVFTGVMPALILVTLTVTGNSVAVEKTAEGIVSETAHATLASAAAQARSSLVDPMAAWKSLRPPGKRKEALLLPIVI